jgi:hypothetical protein
MELFKQIDKRKLNIYKYIDQGIINLCLNVDQSNLCVKIPV